LLHAFFPQSNPQFQHTQVPLLLRSVIKRYSGGVQYYTLNYQQTSTNYEACLESKDTPHVGR